MAQDNYKIQPAYQDDEEIHLGPLWTGIKESFFYLLKKWYLILIWLLIFGGLGLAYAWWYGTKYISTASFAIQGQSASSGLLSSSLSIANSLGLSGSTGKGGGGFDNKFFASLIQSRRVIKESLMLEGMMNGKKDLMANHYIELYKWRTGGLTKKGWNSSPVLKDFKFVSKPLDQLNRLEDSVLNLIYQSIIDNNLTMEYDESSPFNTSTFVTRNYDYSMNMMKLIVDKSAKYFIEDVYELNRKNLGIADSRVDSLGRALKSLDYRVASLQDYTNNLIRQKGTVGVTAAARDRDLLNQQYSAAVNNVELAKVTILTTAPILQVIDDPVFSTTASFVSKVTSFIVGGIIGIFLGSIFTMIARTISESNRKMKERQQLREQNNHDTAAA
ncbi:MAG TPA: hypothetical protein PLD84_05815 [Chitinophagales bacterium]|nr:hypothetical protein [Chitinophagales bacterium]